MKDLEAAYKVCLIELNKNQQVMIDINQVRADLNVISDRFFKRKQENLKEDFGVIISDYDKHYLQFSEVSIEWESKLENIDVVLTGGFEMNNLLDALDYYSDFWKGAFSLAPDVEVPEELKHFEQIGWFEKRADGNGDNNRGCFIKQPGHFPPPIVFYRSGWYVKLDMNLEEYLLTMFENYAVSGWQFFYIEITDDIPRLEEVLEEMRVACDQLPLLFPDKDWSYHINKYDETKRKLGK